MRHMEGLLCNFLCSVFVCQEDLRRRRDEEGRQLDLNASLRLRNLSQNPYSGIDNPTFLQDTPQLPALSGQHTHALLGNTHTHTHSSHYCADLRGQRARRWKLKRC